jgi:hypothetical protein
VSLEQIKEAGAGLAWSWMGLKTAPLRFRAK